MKSKVKSADSKQDKRGATPLLNRIKQGLSGGTFAKTEDPMSWVIESRAQIKFNYYPCWVNGLLVTDHKTDPQSVTVKPYTKGMGKLTGQYGDPIPSSVWRTTTIRRRADGRMNADSVIHAVLKVFLAHEHFVNRAKARKRLKDNARKIRLKAIGDLHNRIEHRNLYETHNNGMSLQSVLNPKKYTPLVEIDAQSIHLTSDSDEHANPLVDMTLEGLTLDEVVELMPIVTSIIQGRESHAEVDR